MLTSEAATYAPAGRTDAMAPVDLPNAPGAVRIKNPPNVNAGVNHSGTMYINLLCRADGSCIAPEMSFNNWLMYASQPSNEICDPQHVTPLTSAHGHVTPHASRLTHTPCTPLAAHDTTDVCTFSRSWSTNYLYRHGHTVVAVEGVMHGQTADATDCLAYASGCKHVLC